MSEKAQAGPLILDVEPHEGGARLDAWLCTRILDMSRTRATEHISSGHVRLLRGPGNAKIKPSLLVHRSMSFEVLLQPRPQMSAEAQEIPLNIVYEDEDVLVIDKPPGLVVHPAAGHEDGTLRRRWRGWAMKCAPGWCIASTKTPLG
jgi:23S rRNA pseudouridine1911/1915/1917 synthase